MKDFFDVLIRSTIGFDAVHHLTSTTTPAYPPYDVFRVDTNSWQIQIALAGYKPEDIEVKEVPESTNRIAGYYSSRKLTVSTIVRPEQQSDEDWHKVHKGIARRKFKTSFVLASDVDVKSAKFQDGLLMIDLVRNVPASPPEKIIPIGE